MPYGRPELGCPRGVRAGDVLALCADRLSGRHLSVTENLDALLCRIDQIERDDLHTLRLRTGR
jgi:hypothetical protein